MPRVAATGSGPGRPAGNRKGKRRKKQEKNPAVRFFPAVLSGFTRILKAALVVTVLLAVIFLWAGGYFGLLGEHVSRMSGSAAVLTGFPVRNVVVRGLENTPPAFVRDAVGPVAGTSVFHTDPGAIRARVEEIGWVHSAAVSRLLPDTLYISVREREPAAVWQMEGRLYLVDYEGSVIGVVDVLQYPHLPLIVGAGAPEAASGMLRVLQEMPELEKHTAALVRIGDRRWNLRTTKGTEIRLPENDAAGAVRDFFLLYTELDIPDGTLEYIDLRNPENFVFGKKEGVPSGSTVRH